MSKVSFMILLAFLFTFLGEKPCAYSRIRSSDRNQRIQEDPAHWKDDVRLYISEERCIEAKQAIADGQWEEAVYLYREALLNDPNNREAILGLRETEERLTQFKNDNVLNTNAQKKLHQKTGQLLERAAIEKSRGRYAEAIAIYGEILVVDPGNRAALRKMKLASEKMEIKKQIRQQVAEYLRKGNELLQKEQYDKAAEMYRNALKLEPKNEDVLKAVDLLEQKKNLVVEQERRRKIDALLDKAMIRQKSGMPEKAKKIYKQVLSMDSKNIAAIDALRVIDIKSKSIEKQDISKTIQQETRQQLEIEDKKSKLKKEKSQKKVEWLLEMAAVRKRSGMVKKAERLYRKVLLEDPENPVALEGLQCLGVLGKEIKEDEPLDAKLKKQIEIKHAIEEARDVVRAESLSYIKRREDIVRKIESEKAVEVTEESKAVTQQNKRVNALLDKAKAAMQEGYFDLSAGIYKRVLTLDNSNSEAKQGLAEIEVNEHRYVRERSVREKILAKRIEKEIYQKDFGRRQEADKDQLMDQIDDLLLEIRIAIRESNFILAREFLEHIHIIISETPDLLDNSESLKREIKNLNEEISIIEKREMDRIRQKKHWRIEPTDN